jgi:hypothetical protein
MKYFAMFCCFLAFSISGAQNKKAATKKAASDWDLLDASFIALIDAIQKNDKVAFTALSLAEVDCIDCVGPTEFNKEGVFVPSAFFLAVIGKNFTQSPVYKSLIKRGYSFSSIVLKDFKPKVMPRDYPKDLKLYEVWVETYRPDEFAKGHKGTSHSFRFVKINGRFKFYGLTSIP